METFRSLGQLAAHLVANKYRAGVRGGSPVRREAAILCEGLESRLLLSSAPFSIAGDTLVFYETSGTGSDAPPEILRITLASSGSTLSAQSSGSSAAPISGTYLYIPAGSSAEVIANLPDGNHTLTLNFSTATSGTTHIVNPDGTEDGPFALLVPPLPAYAPTTISGASIVVTISVGTGPYANSGSGRLTPAASGNTYTEQALTGNIAASGGTYTYVQADAVEGNISYVDTTENFTGETFLAFTSPTGGIFYDTDATPSNNLTDFQAGTFTYSPTAPAVATTIAVVSQNNPAVEGASVTLVAAVSASAATGTVTFMDGTTSLGTGTLDGTGHASLTTANLALGKHAITAVYAGNSSFAASTSAPITQAITHSHDTDVNYVTQLYTDVFKRAVDSAGLTYWVGLLDSGADTFADFATAITSSREYDGDVVDAFYVQYFGRHADAAGLTYWVDKMQSGLNAETIRAGLLGSDEYFSDTGGTNTLFVTALYHSFLGRAPDPAGLNYWLAKFSTETRTQISSSISDSAENRADIVTGFYQSYLQRNPDPSGLAYWESKLANGVTQPQIVTAFVTLPEYLSLHHLS